MTPSTWPALAATTTPLPRADLPIPLQRHQLPIPIPLLLENHNPKCRRLESHPLLLTPNQERGWTTVLQWQWRGGWGTWTEALNNATKKVQAVVEVGHTENGLCFKSENNFLPVMLSFPLPRENCFQLTKVLGCTKHWRMSKITFRKHLHRNKHTPSPYGPSSMLHSLSTHQILKDKQLILKA